MHALGRIAPTADSDERYDNLLDIAKRFTNTARATECNQLNFQTKMVAAANDLSGRVPSVEGALNCPVILRSSQAIVPLRWILSGLDHRITLKFGEVVC